MTLRIKQLATCNERIENFFLTGPVQRAAIEEFAELIIEKCIAITIKAEKNPYLDDGDQARWIRLEIEKYFGLKQ